MANVFPFRGHTPKLGAQAWLAPTATLIGSVTLGDESSVWFGAVLRGDQLAIVLGARTNVQDNSVLHITSDRPIAGAFDDDGVAVGCRVGDDVTIGHSAIVHACRIGNRVLVGMGSIVLDGAEIADDVLIAAGSLVAPGTKIPSGSLVMGRPAKVVRALTDEDRFWSTTAAGLYVGYAREFAREKITR
jgi:carbonic anhydrase/acetyltransferase-like protein (isoleucine patch superfamily)